MNGIRGTPEIRANALSSNAGPEAIPRVRLQDLIDAVNSLRPDAGGTEPASGTGPTDHAELTELLRGV